ncbi:hypothetical protein GUJ93_ZPchr0002g25964 [Zizania palustris]|uniref:Uncharacterized protein n=1 Tax=Zizania palustris TaxID=103762 RepID=A0A8J5S3E5_ZIZPA|nr:hypothetical protein GUJ93_ZPchr0002g25964 [Zizania palustris]
MTGWWLVEASTVRSVVRRSPHRPPKLCRHYQIRPHQGIRCRLIHPTVTANPSLSPPKPPPPARVLTVVVGSALDEASIVARSITVDCQSPRRRCYTCPRQHDALISSAR